MKKVIFTSSTIILALMIGCRKLPDLGNGYKLEHNGMNDLQIENSRNTVIVNGHVLNYAFDSKFIVAAQRPRDSVSGIETMTAKKYEEVFQRSKILKYWIINKTNDSVYGPFEKEIYLLKCEELGLPKELELKEVK